MAQPPVRGEPDHPAGQPIRTAGITPGPAGAVPEHAGSRRIRGQVAGGMNRWDRHIAADRSGPG